MARKARKVNRIVRDVEQAKFDHRRMFVAAEPNAVRKRRIRRAHVQNAKWSAASLEPGSPFAPCKTLETMTPEERSRIEALYGPLSPDARKRVERGVK